LSCIIIEALAKSIDPIVTGFSAVTYPDWESLFLNLNNTLKGKTTVCLDEFPYLIKNSPELPSVYKQFHIYQSGIHHLVLPPDGGVMALMEHQWR